MTSAQQSQFEKEILDDGRLSFGKVTHAFVYTLEPENDGMSIYLNGLPLPAATMEHNYSEKYPQWQ